MIEITGKLFSTKKIATKDVFSDEMWFSIPNYQRPYVWREDQIVTLLDDIAYSAENTNDAEYFLGPLVLHCSNKFRNDTKYVENSILDGQQRLTTLYMLHAVVRDTTDNDTRKQSCSKVIFQDGNPDDGIPERMRLEFDIRNDVEKFINDHIKKIAGTLEDHKLQEFVHKSNDVSVRNMANAILVIRKWFKDAKIDINTFFPYLRQNVIFIYVASGQLDDAFQLFTVLNDRGIKLRTSDILKARNLAKINDKERRNQYALFWEDLEGELGEDIDKFLSYIRTILVKEKARKSLLAEYEDNIYSPKEYNQSTREYDTLNPIIEKGEETFVCIKNYKDHYDSIFSGNNYDLTNNWSFDNLITLLHDTALSDVWIPPLLSFRKHFGDSRLYDFLVLLDNKFSGDWIAQETPTKILESMNNIIKKIEEIYNNSEDNKSKIDSLFLSEIFNFNSTEFIRRIDELDVYSKTYSKYILRKIDYILDKPLYTERRNSYNKMSVEHILPQTPSDNSKWVFDYTEDERNKWTNRLGNLVLISRRKNAIQGRLDFDDKKDTYFANSIESFPNSLKVMNKPNWKIDDLMQHHTYLINLIKNYYNIYRKK